jgi:hypothetical protein
MSAVLAERNELTPAALSDRIARLCEPETLDLEGAGRALGGLSVGLLPEPRFMGLEPEQTRNALGNFVAACRPYVGRKPPTKNATVLECPLGAPESSGFWIALAESVLSWTNATPSVLLPSQEPRMVLALGPLPACSLAWLRKPESCRASILSLTGSSSIPPDSWPDLAQEGTLDEFFASLRPLGTP